MCTKCEHNETDEVNTTVTTNIRNDGREARDADSRSCPNADSARDPVICYHLFLGSTNIYLKLGYIYKTGTTMRMMMRPPPLSLPTSGTTDGALRRNRVSSPRYLSLLFLA